MWWDHLVDLQELQIKFQNFLVRLRFDYMDELNDLTIASHQSVLDDLVTHFGIGCQGTGWRQFCHVLVQLFFVQVQRGPCITLGISDSLWEPNLY